MKYCVLRLIYHVRYLTLNKQAGSVDAMRQLDDLLVQLAGSVNTDLLPGKKTKTIAYSYIHIYNHH